MALPHYFAQDVMRKEKSTILKWYQKHIVHVLEEAKQHHARDADETLAMGKHLIDILNTKVDPPKEVPLREVPRSEDATLMKPVEPEVADIFYKSTEKGATERYLHERYKKTPEEKFHFRIVSSWDYGWHQKDAMVAPRDVNYGNCHVIKHSFYRRNNLGPDPAHYGQPAGGEVSICSQYSCGK